jgi:hypothetical protein
MLGAGWTLDAEGEKLAVGWLLEAWGVGVGESWQGFGVGMKSFVGESDSKTGAREPFALYWASTYVPILFFDNSISCPKKRAEIWSCRHTPPSQNLEIGCGSQNVYSCSEQL